MPSNNRANRKTKNPKIPIYLYCFSSFKGFKSYIRNFAQSFVSTQLTQCKSNPYHKSQNTYSIYLIDLPQRRKTHTQSSTQITTVDRWHAHCNLKIAVKLTVFTRIPTKFTKHRTNFHPYFQFCLLAVRQLSPCPTFAIVYTKNRQRGKHSPQPAAYDACHINTNHKRMIEWKEKKVRRRQRKRYCKKECATYVTYYPKSKTAQ